MTEPAEKHDIRILDDRQAQVRGEPKPSLAKHEGKPPLTPEERERLLETGFGRHEEVLRIIQEIREGKRLPDPNRSSKQILDEAIARSREELRPFFDEVESRPPPTPGAIERAREGFKKHEEVMQIIRQYLEAKGIGASDGRR